LSSSLDFSLFSIKITKFYSQQQDLIQNNSKLRNYKLKLEKQNYKLDDIIDCNFIDNQQKNNFDNNSIKFTNINSRDIIKLSTSKMIIDKHKKIYFAFLNINLKLMN